MRKILFLLLAFCLPVLFPTSLYAWVMCETSVETLDVAGEVTFTSGFCNCPDGDMITVEIWPADPGVEIDSVVFTKATPHWAPNESWAEQLGVTFYSADVLLCKVTERPHTIHLWVYLSTEEHIGVNAHF